MPRKVEPTTALGRLIGEQRGLRGWSLDDLAGAVKREGVEVSRQTLGDLEKGADESDPGALRLAALARALELPLAIVMAAAGVYERGAPANSAELSLEEQGAIKELRAMPPDERRKWVHMLRAARAYAQDAPSSLHQGRPGRSVPE